MKRDLGVSGFVKQAAVAVALVLVAGVLASDGLGEPVDAQMGSEVSGGVTGMAESSADASNGDPGPAASPASLPLPSSHFTGSVMHKRTVGMERFDTDHDIDGADGVDREILGSHYVMNNAFKVRIPAIYEDKPEGVFGFSFNHIVFEMGSSRFTADCSNQRTYLYRDTSSWRWICSLNFGSRANSWNSAIRTASEIKIVAFWSDKSCEDGSFGIKIGDEEKGLTADCRALLTVKHYWLDEVANNRDRLSPVHSLRTWGVGNIKDWGGVLVDAFPNDDKSLRNECGKKGDDCSPRVVVVDLGVDVNGRDSKKIKGGIPAEFGDLKALVALNLYNNLLSGAIPAELGNDEFAPCHKSTRTPGLYLIVVTIDLGEYNIPVNANDCRQNSESRVTREELESSEFTRSLTSSPVATSGGGTVASVSAKTVMPKVGLFSNTDSNGNQTFNLRAVSKYSKNTAKGLDVIAENFVKKGSKAFKALKTLNVALSRFALFVDGLFFVESITRVEHYEYLEYGRSQLKFLDLSRNALSGQIPASLGRLNKLRFLYLNDNYLAGALPSGIGMGGRIDGTYDSLVHLNASNNQLSGQIPNGLSMALEYIDLGYNQLTEIIPWESIGRLYLLAGLYLNNNRNLVLGDIPEPSGLVSYAWPDYPAVSSAAPGHYDNLNLTYLDLSNNSFGGAVPDGIFKFWGLQELSLGDNDFVALSDGSSDDFVGYWQLLSLRRLDLSDNNLYVIPEFGKLKRLKYFDFSGNRLDNSNDSLKSFLMNTNVWRLEYVDLSDNFISYVPELISFLSLTYLYLNDNCLVSSAKGQISNKDFEELIEFDETGNYFNQTLANPVKDECGEIDDCSNGAFVDNPVSYKELVDDCTVLLALREHWHDTSAKSVLSGWGTGSQKKIQDWSRVTVSGARVTGLDFSDLGIMGVVPEQISRLDELRQLDLSGNELSGDLPGSLAGLENLWRLDLSGNAFTSSIWDETGDVLFSLKDLDELYLSDMAIGGRFPLGLRQLTELRVLDLSGNELTGEIPSELWIPGEVRYFKNLVSLDLSRNKLSGVIPCGFIESLRSVWDLNLSSNRFTGQIPLNNSPVNDVCMSPGGANGKGLANLTGLEKLNLSHNSLTGKIPEDIALIGYLQYSEGTELKLNDNCFTGALPEDLTKIDIVDISNNNLDYTGWQGAVGTARKECVAGGCSGGVLVEKPDEDVELVADCEVLLELLEVWSGDALDDWGTKEISEWAGVTVPDERVVDRRVTGLSLPNQGISGVVLAVIGDLGGLKVLDLSGNRLWGALPREVGNLSVLEVLVLSGNSLSGALPGEVGGLSVLTDLDLSDNNLSGGLPAGLGRLGKLERLDLSGNGFSGRIPSGLGRLSSLTDLDLSDNRLSGEIRAVSGRIPAGLGRLASLEVLDLSGNGLSGEIPAGLGGLVKLEVLDLSGNGLSGEIPAGLGGLSNLERLVLSDNSLSGGIPSELENLRALEAGGLDLRRNCLLRPVPGLVSDLGESIARLGWNLFLTPDDNPWCVPCSDGTFLPRSSTRNLIRDCFWLVEARRALHGESGVPEFSVAAGWGTAQNPDMHRWGGVSIQRGRVRSLDLSVPLSYWFIASTGAASSLYRSEKLTGSIPAEFAALGALESLNLSNNRFEGGIPIEIGSLSRLVSLDLSRNRLSGEVPEDLGDLLELESLDLSHNRLEGPVSEALGQPAGGSKQLVALFLNDNFLTGSIPGVLGNLSLVSLHLHYNCIVGATPANLFDDATPANLKVKDFKREPNRGNCADGCSNGKYVASPGENKSLVNDCRALLAARDSWAEWGSLSSQAHISNWGSGESAKIGDWGGVEVVDSGGEMRVVGLALPGNGLSEGIPETLEDLGGLVSLDLSHNKITDPNGGLGKLAVSADLVELDLSANGIKGQIPTSIGGLSKLRRLVLSDNELSGIIPSGPTPVPGATPLLDRLPALEHLDLSGNALKGLVPSSLSVLKHLDLSDNEITGRLPGGLFEAEELSHLDLSDNQLAGALPEKLYEHSGLVYLDLSHNRFSGAVKSGFKSKTLVRLDLSDNRFTGSLPGLLLAGLPPIKIPTMPPDAVGAIERYLVLEDGNSRDFIRSPVYLDLSGNERSASLADLREAGYTVIEIPNMPPSATGRSAKYLVLGDTVVSGSKSGGYFGSLVYLDLSGNQFTGPVPLGYGNFADERPMERLDLSRNQLIGDLPEWIKLLQFSDSDDYERSSDSLTNPEPDTFLVSLEHNQMCTPQDYALGDFRRNNGKTAPVDIKLGNNECPEDDFGSLFVPGPVLGLRVRVAGADRSDLRVSWKHPKGQSGLNYIVEPVLKDTAPIDLPELEACRVATTAAEVFLTEESGTDCEDLDARHYTAEVTPVYAPAGSANRYYGETGKLGGLPVWSYRTVQQSTTPLAVHRSLRLAADQGMWRWDGPAQVWRQHSPTDASFTSHALVAGDTLAFRDFPVDADLVAAKLGSIDHDTRVTLYDGWNIIPAGGSAIRAEGENGDWFLNRYFINCGQSTNRYAVNGVFGFTKVLVYDAEEQTFALEIPCDQALETPNSGINHEPHAELPETSRAPRPTA